MKIFQGRIIEVEVETVELPNGSSLELEIVRHPGGAAVVALDERMQVCLLRQFRPALGAWLWEIPAGKIDDDEPPFETARRELAEEAGLAAGRWVELGSMVSSPGVFTERVHLYLARDLSAVPDTPHPAEIFELHWVPLHDAVERARSGAITDAKSALALLRAAASLDIV
ncbi:MAG: NUDIX domain-containing protein [Gammaproteobacteria bacterium]